MVKNPSGIIIKDRALSNELADFSSTNSPIKNPNQPNKINFKQRINKNSMSPTSLSPKSSGTPKKDLININ